MSKKTKPFRDQHEKLLEIIDEITGYLENGVVENSHRMSKLLADLSRNVKVHLALEDTSLYPVLQYTEDKEIKKTATAFMKEMGDIKKVFEQYIAKWPSGFKIEENPALFKEETLQIVDSLRNRIERENTGLYTMIDEMFT